jgi:transketolase
MIVGASRSEVDRLTSIDEATLHELDAKAKTLRRHVIRMTHAAGSGHPGGSLSSADIMAALFFRVMAHRPGEPEWPERDHFILSKGHVAPVYYAALAESGYFPVEDLIRLRKLDCHLQGHPCRDKTPGVEMSTGSLGQGLSVSNGIALASKLDKHRGRVYCLCGDGEQAEGQIWEAAMLAAHYGLDNVTLFIDRNGLQIDGPTERVMSLEPLAEKWKAFRWNVLIIDGHDMSQILHACEEAKATKGRPTVVIAKTVKGKGVSFMENNVGFHGKAPSTEEARKAMQELGGEL